MIEVISPAGFEGFFWELSELASAGQPAFEAVAEIAERYGLQFGRPDWLPDLIDPYGLNPPPEA
jgi:hypothetical protein